MGARPLIRSADIQPLDTDLDIPGNILTLDSDNAGSAADCFIVAEQGTGANGGFKYNHTTGKWQYSNNGGAYVDAVPGPTRPPLDSAHVAAWFFDGAAGSTEPNEGTGAAMALTAGGTEPIIRAAPGLFGPCAHKDVPSGFYSGTVGSPAIDIPDDFVMECWFKCNYNTLATYQLFNKCYAYSWATPGIAGLYIYTGRISARLVINPLLPTVTYLGKQRTGGPSILVPVGEWHHAALRYESSGRVTSLFYDGLLVDQITAANALVKNSNSGPWTVGCQYSGSLTTESLYGALADARLTDMSIAYRDDSYFDDVYHIGKGY